MKAVIKLELFGENTRQMCKVYRSAFRENGCAEIFDTVVGVPPRSSWVAEVLGPSEKYRLERNFLKPKLDYSRANGIGSRGVFAEYILESGKLYEVKSQESWSRTDRYFCIVDQDGDVIKISEEDACHSIGAETYQERRVKISAKNISRY
ncbi:hypothetical protein [Solibaculum intestinale]|uniref:Uncharacterized protein n=1 Tax=Solibaculum intestinale TaxID=3133165 RepID=A0ABV1E6Y1_9FIRM